MTRLWAEGETINVELGTAGWPTRFTWRGRTHPVLNIQQRWQVDGDWWTDAGYTWREYMAVTTDDGLFCVIYFDLIRQQWHLSRLYD